MNKEISLGKGSLIALLVILLTTSGCYSFRKISQEQIPMPGKDLYQVILKDSSFLINNARLENDILTGTLDTAKGKLPKRQLIKVWVNDASSVTTEGDKVSIHVNKVVKFQSYRIDLIKIAGLVVVSWPLLFIISLAIGGGYGM